MKKIKPYKSLRGALQALDNGGRFYNLFTQAGDQVISSKELYKAAGVISDKTSAVLFFELALSQLADGDKRQVIARLAPQLKELRRDQKILSPAPGNFARSATEGQGILVAGYPRFLHDKSQFSGFIMIPISTGNTTTFMMIPIYEQFDLYEVFADAPGKGDKLIVAAAKGKQQLSQTPTTFGGVAKKLSDKKDGDPKTLYMEAAYYI